MDAEIITHGIGEGRRFMRQTLLINGFLVEAVYDEQVIKDIFAPLLQNLRALWQNKQGRLIVFFAAPPATGKSTLCAFLEKLACELPDMPKVQAIGMDGFHYHQDYILSHSVLRGGVEIPMRRIKGAPESFDVYKLKEALERLRAENILWPVYDRTLHDVVENALHVTADIVLVEGNYLLLDEAVWRELPHDYAVFIEAEEAFLRERLLTRKMRGGATQEEALSHYETADGPNVRLTLKKRLPADLTIHMTGDGQFTL